MELEQRYGAWTGARIEHFLSESLAPMRVGLQTRKGPLIVPLWFSYREGSLWSCSPRTSTLARTLVNEPEVAFDISTNDIPYQGVRGRALADCLVPDDSAELEALLVRYLGSTDNQLGGWLLSRADNELVIRWEITWITSWDFSSRMGDIRNTGARAQHNPS